MRFREIELPTAVPGRLLLHSMPGRYESWAGFLTEARTEGVSQVACLASNQRNVTADWRDQRLERRSITLAAFLFSGLSSRERR